MIKIFSKKISKNFYYFFIWRVEFLVFLHIFSKKVYYIRFYFYGVQI